VSGSRKINQDSAWPRLTLRRNDQAVVATFLAVALVILAGSWLWHRTFGVGLVDIERAEPVAIQFQIDVNRADWPELALMPNIGEQLSKRIVADRAERGAYKNWDELLRVRGIGPKTLEGMKPFLMPLPSSADKAVTKVSDSTVTPK
jgi:competence protein ComEA